MKIGLDIHGVIDKDPRTFAELARVLIAAGHEVHIITGQRWDVAERILKAHKVPYTHHFSILDHYRGHLAAKIWKDEHGNEWMDAEMWNRAKALYCAKHGIKLHIDDSDMYGKYFKTPYAQLR